MIDRLPEEDIAALDPLGIIVFSWVASPDWVATRLSICHAGAALVARMFWGWFPPLQRLFLVTNMRVVQVER